jgi:hypothetical protein
VTVSWSGTGCAVDVGGGVSELGEALGVMAGEALGTGESTGVTAVGLGSGTTGPWDGLANPEVTLAQVKRANKSIRLGIRKFFCG